MHTKKSKSPKRDVISKKLRFEVFKRDGFVCQYCGKHPPEVTLELDHIQPKSKDGNNDINNLITACFDCNRGKGSIELDKIPNTLMLNKEILEERESQYVEYHKLLAKIDRRVKQEINDVVAVFENAFIKNKRTLTENFKRNSIRGFIDKLGGYEVLDAMEIATSKFVGIKRSANYTIYEIEADCIKYFCGICWNKIKKTKNG